MREPCRAARVEGAEDVLALVPLVELGEHAIRERLDRRDREQRTRLAQRRKVGRVADEVLDLRGEVEGDRREARVERGGHPQRVAGPVQEVGITERDVRDALCDLAPDVVEHDLERYGEEAAAIERGDGAMAAEVQAAARRFRVAGEPLAARLREARVALRRRQPAAARDREVELLERGRARPGTQERRKIAAALDGARERHEVLLALAGEQGDRARRAQGSIVERCVQSVKREQGRRVELAHARGGPQRELEGGVHRHREDDEARGADALRVERLHCHVERGGRVSCALEKRLRPGDAGGLVTELVSRDEEDGARRAERDRCARACLAGSAARGLPPSCSFLARLHAA